MSDSFLSAVETRAKEVCARTTVLALCCNNCQAVVATADELLKDQVPTAEGAVWAYELDLLDVTAYCYSATNPDDARFDVGRFNADACARLRWSGTPEPAHSWFPRSKNTLSGYFTLKQSSSIMTSMLWCDRST